MGDPAAQLPDPLGSMVASARLPVIVADESLTARRGTLLLLRVTESPSDDLLATLMLQHEVVVRTNIDDSADVVFDAAVIESDHATLEQARAVARRFQGNGGAKPGGLRP